MTYCRTMHTCTQRGQWGGDGEDGVLLLFLLEMIHMKGSSAWRPRFVPYFFLRLILFLYSQSCTLIRMYVCMLLCMYIYTPCLRKTCAKLFLSELCQISINFNNFWQVDEKMAKVTCYINIFHLTSLMSSQ